MMDVHQSGWLTPNRGFWIVVAFSILILPIVLLLPFGHDHSTYQSMALEWIRHDKLPYVGSWDLNFPGIVFIHALSIALFGSSDVSFRVIDALSYFIATLVLYKLAVRSLAPGYAMLGCFLFVILYIPEGSWNAGQRDTFCMMFMLSSILVLLKGVESQRSDSLLIFCSGLLMGITLIIRPNYALFSLATLAALWQIDRALFFRRAMLYSGGSILFLLLFLLWYAFVPNGLHEFYLAAICFNLDIYAGRILEERSWTRFILAVVMIGAILFFRRQHRRYGLPNTGKIHPKWYDAEVIELYALCMLITLASMRKFFAYHFTPFYPVGYMILAFAIASAIDKRKVPKQLFYSLFIALLLFHYYPRKLVGAFLSEGMRNSWSSAYQDVVFTQPQFLRDEITMTNRIKTNTTSADMIEVCARDAGVRWRAERPLATRFTTVYPLALSDQGRFTDYQLSWREEFVRDLERVQPKYIVLESTTPVNESGFIQDFTPNFRDLQSNLPTLGKLLSDRYELDTILETYTSFRRRK